MQNGEIYNYVELTQELEALGHRFETTSDTEVIAHAYEEWGADCLQRLNGDFAFAVWDREEQELFLARDRFGVRPLFIAEFGGDLSFASEAKALLPPPGGPPRARSGSASSRHSRPGRSFPSAPPSSASASSLRRTTCAGRRRRPRRGEALVGPRVPARRRAAGAERAELKAELRELLTDATRIRLRADVPVAAYLSGGLDSSATAALARRLYPNTLFSFGIGFRDPRFDESVFQDRFVEELGTSLTRVVVDAPRHRELLPRAVELVREADAAHGPRAAAVALRSGPGREPQGRDHGRRRRRALRRLRHLPREQSAPTSGPAIPESQLRPLLFARLNEYLGRDLKRSGAFLAGFYRRGLEDTDDPLYSHRIRYANTARCLRLFDPDVVERAAAAGDVLERTEARLPDGFERLTPARPGPVSRDHDLSRGLPAALPGRPDADGPLDRGSLPVPRLPRSRVRGRAPRRHEGARPRRRSTCCARRRQRCSCRDRRSRRSGRTVLRSPLPSSAPQAPDYVRELLAPRPPARRRRLRAGGRPAPRARSARPPRATSARPTRWRSSARSRSCSSTSSSSPARRSLRPRRPTQLVVGDSVGAAAAAVLNMRERRLLHDSLLAAAELHPGKDALVVEGQRCSYDGASGHVASPRARAAGSWASSAATGSSCSRTTLCCVSSSIFGTLLAGGVFVVVNPQTKEDKLAYMLEDSEAAFLVTEGSIARVASRAGEAAPSLKATICGGRRRRRRGHARLRRPR